MATLNLGRIKPIFKGAYAGGTAYVVDDIVTSGNECFICILASTGNATSNATYWTKLAAKGTDGTDLTSTLTTQGDIVYRDGSGLARLGFGTTGNVLTTKGTGANPVWEAASGGKIGQVVFASKTDRFTSSVEDAWVDSGLTATITPTATNSRIWVMMNLGAVGSSNDALAMGFRIYRSGSGVTDGEIGIGTASGYSGLSLRGASFGEQFHSASATYLSYPVGGVSWLDTTHNQTSALTYKLQMATADAGTMVLNGVNASGTTTPYPSTVSTVTLWEILA